MNAYLIVLVFVSIFGFGSNITGQTHQHSSPPSVSQEDWEGKWVIPRSQAQVFTEKSGEKSAYDWIEFSAPFYVHRQQGEMLLIEGEKPKFWIRKKDVVSMENGFLVYQQLVVQQPENARALAELAEIGSVPGDFAAPPKLNAKQQIELSSQAIRLDSNQLLAYLVRARAHMKLKQLKLAEKDIFRALELAPESARVNNYLANLLSAKGESEAARKQYQKAAKLLGRDVYFYNLAIHAMEADDLELAEQYFAKALKTNAYNPTVHFATGHFHWQYRIRANSRRMAIEHLKTACRLTQWRNPKFMDTLVRFHFELGEKQEAKKYREMISRVRRELAKDN